MFDLWVWVSSGACARPERQVSSHAAEVLWPLEYLQGMENIAAGMKEALNCAERDNRKIIQQLRSLIDTEERQNFKYKFPFGFSYDIHLLGIRRIWISMPLVLCSLHMKFSQDY